MHSIYLRGSIASKSAVPYFSDIDTFALVYTGNDYIRWDEPIWSKSFIKEMQDKYDYVRHIDLNISSYKEDVFLVNPKLAMVLQTQSCCLYGESIINTIKKFKPGQEMMLNLRWLNEDLTEFLKITKEDPQYEVKNSIILKIIIRCGFELVMERVNKFTNSLFHCQLSFASIYPEKGKQMERLLFFFLNPQLCGEESEIIIREMGEFILSESNKLAYKN